MLYQKLQLDETDENVFLECFVADKTENYVRDAMLVIPGGGYGGICSNREGEPIAQAFMPYGFNAFVLHYSVGEKAKFPRPLIEASKAVKHIKDNAEKYNINPSRVFAVGFSAGGHLTAALGALWHIQEIYDAVPMEYGYNKPAGVIPVYPVITCFEGTHVGSMQNLCGCKNPTDEQKKKYSLEYCVDEKCAPMFLVHTATDQAVPVRNSFVMAEALSENHIPFELHIFENAPHGMALGNAITAGNEPLFNQPSLASWVASAAEWTKRRH